MEIYEKTCCCTITIHDLDDFLVRIKDWFLKFPPPPPDPPFPGPSPDPMLDPIPDKDADRTLKLARSSDIKIPLGNPPQRLLQDVQILSSLSPNEKLAYFDIHDYLYPLFCYCTSKKVGETTINEKGEFSHCFPKKFYIRNCRTSYFYKVKQWHENQWVYIYDGSNINDYFRADEEASLRTWKGMACGPDEGITPPGEFVLLENIGAIPSWELKSNTEL